MGTMGQLKRNGNPPSIPYCKQYEIFSCGRRCSDEFLPAAFALTAFVIFTAFTFAMFFVNAFEEYVVCML
jgi:hypothetical protein